MTELRGLGFLRVQSTDVARWRELLIDGLGMAVGSGPEADALYARIDERRSRIAVLPGDSDKALAVGWEVRDEFALERVRQAVEAAGVAVTVMSRKEAGYIDAEGASSDALGAVGCGASLPQNSAAVQTITADWINDFFTGSHTGIYGPQGTTVAVNGATGSVLAANG